MQPIDEREGMDRGGEGASAKEENGGRAWLPAEAMTVDDRWRLVCDCVLWYMKDQAGIQGVSARTFSTRPKGVLLELQATRTQLTK